MRYLYRSSIVNIVLCNLCWILTLSKNNARGNRYRSLQGSWTLTVCHCWVSMYLSSVEYPASKRMIIAMFESLYPLEPRNYGSSWRFLSEPVGKFSEQWFCNDREWLLRGKVTSRRLSRVPFHKIVPWQDLNPRTTEYQTPHTQRSTFSRAHIVWYPPYISYNHPSWIDKPLRFVL